MINNTDFDVWEDTTELTDGQTDEHNEELSEQHTQKTGKEEIGKKEIFLSVLFVVWFFGSLCFFAASTSFEDGYKMAIATLGQFFAVIGTIAVVKSRKTIIIMPIIALIPIVGYSVFGIGLYLCFGGPSAEETLLDMLPFLAATAYALVGIAIFVFIIFRDIYLKRACTHSCSARIVALKTKMSRRKRGGYHKLYAPVYLITNPKNESDMIEISSGNYNNIHKYKVGDIVNIKVNPDDPNEFIDRSTGSGNIISFVIATIFIIVVILILVLIV